MECEWRRRLASLADTLAVEYRQIEMLVFKLVETRLVLSAGETRLATRMVTEINEVFGLVENATTNTAQATVRLAEAISRSPAEVTYQFLSGWAPEPYATVFARRREQFSAFVQEIDQALLEIVRLSGKPAPTFERIRNWADSAREVLGDGAPSGDPQVLYLEKARFSPHTEKAQEWVDLDKAAAELDLQLSCYRMAGATLAKRVQPSLDAFLG